MNGPGNRSRTLLVSERTRQGSSPRRRPCTPFQRNHIPADMTLRSRLTLGLLTIAVILIVPLLVATQSLNRLHRETKALRDGEFAASLLLGRLRDALNDLKTAEMAVLFVREEKSRETMMERIHDVEIL